MKWLCISLIALNVLLLVKLIIAGLGEQAFSAAVPIVLIGLSIVGIVGITKEKPKLVYLYCFLSFIPVGYYLLGIPSIYVFIGIINLVVLVIYKFTPVRKTETP